MSIYGKPPRTWHLGKYRFPYYISQLDNLCQKEMKKASLVLDAGCGDKISSFSIVPENVTAVCIDISKKNVTQSHKQAKQKKQTNINYIQADITALPFKNEIFELVTSRDVIEHIPDNQLTVNEIYRVCKKDGVFTGTTSNKLNPVFFLDSFLPNEIMNILTQKYAGDHYERHTRPTTKILHKLLQNSGFKKTHISLTGYPLFQAWDYQPDASTPKLKLPAYAYIWILFDKITKTIPLQQLKEAIVFHSTK